MITKAVWPGQFQPAGIAAGPLNRPKGCGNSGAVGFALETRKSIPENLPDRFPSIGDYPQVEFHVKVELLDDVSVETDPGNCQKVALPLGS